MVLVHTKIALSEAAPCQKTNRVVKVIDEISPVCAALDLAVYPLIVQMIVRHDVLYLCRKGRGIFVKEPRPSTRHVLCANNSFWYYGVSKRLWDINLVVFSYRIIVQKKENSVSGVFVICAYFHWRKVWKSVFLPPD